METLTLNTFVPLTKVKRKSAVSSDAVRGSKVRRVAGGAVGCQDDGKTEATRPEKVSPGDGGRRKVGPISRSVSGGVKALPKQTRAVTSTALGENTSPEHDVPLRAGSKWFAGAQPQKGTIPVQFPELSSKVSTPRPVSTPAAPTRKTSGPANTSKEPARPKKVPHQQKIVYDEYSSLHDGGSEIEPVEERLFSKKSFQDLAVHPHLVGNLSQLFGINAATVVQRKTIPVLLSGKHALVRSQTGSGKTLAYAVPIMHCLEAGRPKLSRKDGVKALVVLPTRELALQTYECFAKLMRAFTWIVPGIVVGGEKRKSEKVRLRKGITVLVGTPGRLLDHAEHTDSLSLHGIDWLVIDEADKLLEMGYEKDIAELMAVIDRHRDGHPEKVGLKQTVLLSATLSPGVERLANLALHDPTRIDSCSEPAPLTTLVVPQSIQQRYLLVPAKLRLVGLASFIVDVTEFKNSRKILVFMATQDMVDFYVDLLQTGLPSSLTFHKLHGSMSQGDRTEVFNTFRASERGILLSTDVAARGLDLTKVDTIVQFTAPTSAAEYVHRVGRTARAGASGSSFLFLLPSELHFISLLNTSRLKLEEISVDQVLSSLLKIKLESREDGLGWGGGVEGASTVLQQNFERAVLDEPDLHALACKAYKSWVRFYASYPKEVRVIFDFKSLHLGHHAKSFALRDAPRSIGGLGRPSKPDKSTKRRKNDNLGHTTAVSRVRRLVNSEFDSGLRQSKKKL